MDDIVRQAMAKWPRVPHCFGWLGLDARGRWHLRDAQAQALGPFGSDVPGSGGTLLQHDRLVAFIGRNYEVDERGQWFFQNGPQRVYVELEVAPWIWRVADDGSVTSHIGVAARVEQVFLDETGRLFLLSARGLGLVHTMDMIAASGQVERGAWLPQAVEASTLAARFGFVPSPQRLADPVP